MFEQVEWRNGWLWVRGTPTGEWRRATDARLAQYVESLLRQLREMHIAEANRLYGGANEQ